MDIRTNEDEPTEPVESDSEDVAIMTEAEYLRSQRTLTEQEVAKRAAAHDADDYRPSERVAFDTGSMRRVQR